jgi:hypothetical protein
VSKVSKDECENLPSMSTYRSQNTQNTQYLGVAFMHLARVSAIGRLWHEITVSETWYGFDAPGACMGIPIPGIPVPPIGMCIILNNGQWSFLSPSA